MILFTHIRIHAYIIRIYAEAKAYDTCVIIFQDWKLYKYQSTDGLSRFAIGP